MSFQVPDWIEAAVGWRSWKVEMLELRSVSMTSYPRWTPLQQNQAQCHTKHAYVWTNVPEDDPRPCWLKYLQEQGIERCAGGRAIGDYAMEQVNSKYVPPGYVKRLLPHEPAPCPNHECGIYAVTELKKLSTYANYDRAVGTVSLWGKAMPGESGYRAEYAYPKEIWIPARTEDLETRTRVAELLADQYLIPVHVGVSEEICDGLRLSNSQPRFESLISG